MIIRNDFTDTFKFIVTQQLGKSTCCHFGASLNPGNSSNSGIPAFESLPQLAE